MTTLMPLSETEVFDLICKQADVLAQSGIVPAAYRRKPTDIIAAGLAGRAYGWDAMTALRNFHVIEGTASLRPEAMLGLVRQAGHSVTIDVQPGVATATGKRADTGDQHQAVFTIGDAQNAGLAGKKNWKQYEGAMLTWRAVSALCRVLFPDVVLGAGYVPEEIGGDVDSNGEVLEAETVDPPALEVAPEPIAYATADEIDALRQSIGLLDVVDRELLKAWWKDEGIPPLDSGKVPADRLDDIWSQLGADIEPDPVAVT